MAAVGSIGAKLDLVIRQGADFRLRLTFRNADTTPLDLTNITPRAQLRDSYVSTTSTSFTFEIAPTPTDGWMDMSMSNTATAALRNPSTLVQLPQHVNSTEPASATLSNTVPSYTTLGGRFQFAPVAQAATDWLLFAYLVPADFYVTGVQVNSWNIGAASATTPTLLIWSLAVGAATASLVGVNSGARIGIGTQSYPVGTAIGAIVAPCGVQYLPPLKCASGKYIQIIMRNPIGTVTASRLIAGIIDVQGYFA